MKEDFRRVNVQAIKQRFALLIGLISVVGLMSLITGSVRASALSSGKERSYKFLNPRGIKPPVQINPLALRLNGIGGKVIYVNMGESERADPVIMPLLYKQLKETYPKTEWRWIGTRGFGPDTPEEEVLRNAHAVIRGVAW